VSGLNDTISCLAANRRLFEKWTGRQRPGAHYGTASVLRETVSFGSNPGNLKMLSYVPAGLGPSRPMVVVLHGCKQTAAGYGVGAGWSTLADRLGFVLLLPEQMQSNNPSKCFSWFQPQDSLRDLGEALSIRQMIETMSIKEDVDPTRIFVTGLSAGGAMTSAMLASYPELFAAGAIIAGLPYGAASNVQQAFESMFQCPPKSPKHWGDLVRKAAPASGRWPRISVWHGSADHTVVPANAAEILKQWTNVHGLPNVSSAQSIVNGYTRDVWMNAAGEEIIESFTIRGMGHGTPLATGEAADQCGEAGPFLLDVGISSSYHIAKFFGLTSGGVRANARGTEAQEPFPDVTGDSAFRGSIHRNGNVGRIISSALRAAGLIRKG
jgi:poly(hydroxyalkanoate) depolymerase family esterase